MPEGRDGKGWRSFASELRLVVQFFQLQYGGGSAGLRNGSHSVLDVGKSLSVLVLKPPVEVGMNRSFAEVLVGLRKF